jgi:hypothetical protein
MKLSFFRTPLYLGRSVRSFSVDYGRRLRCHGGGAFKGLLHLPTPVEEDLLYYFFVYRTNGLFRLRLRRSSPPQTQDHALKAWKGGPTASSSSSPPATPSSATTSAVVWLRRKRSELAWLC